MTISEMAVKMIAYSNGNLHDINHFMKVYAYAKTIGECEGLDSQTQSILEAAALLHDIACPLCREKYGNVHGPNQEAEGEILTAEFLKDSGLPEAFIERVVFLVGHHHTLGEISGQDYQILIEADYLVNADELRLPPEKIRRMMERTFKTPTGTALLKTMYRLE